MPSRGRKFITEFLLPSLNEKRFGARLMWLDSVNKVFQIQWNHKSASGWTANDAAVFAAWDQRKGHYKPQDKEYYTKSKQRFRAALYKFIKHKHITELFSEDKYMKICCIGDGKNICARNIAIPISEKENDQNSNSSQNAEQYVPVDWSSINGNLFTDLQVNYSAPYNYREESLEMKLKDEDHEDYQEIKEEQVVSDNTVDFTLKARCDNEKDSFQCLRFCDDEKKLCANETSNCMREYENLKPLHLECSVPETVLKNENHLKKAKSIENENFHDYALDTMDISKEWVWSHVNIKNDDYEDALVEWPFPCI